MINKNTRILTAFVITIFTAFSCSNVTAEPLEQRLEQIRFEVNLTHKLDRPADIDRAEEVRKLVEKVFNNSRFWTRIRNYRNYRFAKWSRNIGDSWVDVSGDQI